MRRRNRRPYRDRSEAGLRFYQAAIGVFALVLVLLLGREKTLVKVRVWIVEMAR